MAKYTLNEVADELAKVHKKMAGLPVNDTSQVILDLLQIQVMMAHVMADYVNNKK